MPPGALATILVGTQPTNQLLTGQPPVQNGCWLLVPASGPGALATLPIGFGPSLSYDFDLPEWLGPLNLEFQGVHFDAATVEVLTTTRLSVPLIK